MSFKYILVHVDHTKGCERRLQLAVHLAKQHGAHLRALYARGGSVDTMRRYVYIHGCPDSDAMGVPGSHGCVKMRNSDMIALFDRIEVGTRVLITEQ